MLGFQTFPGVELLLPESQGPDLEKGHNGTSPRVSARGQNDRPDVGVLQKAQSRR